MIDEAPVTRLSLLLRLRDPQDAEAWRQFVQVYAAVVYGFARKRGLQDADAADLMQDVFRAVAAAVGRLQYDRSRGGFRAWLYTVTRNKLYNFLTSRRRRERGSGDSDTRALLEAHPAPPDGAADWDQEYERGVFAWAAERVRGDVSEQTWQAFWLTAVDNVAAKEAGARLGMSPGAVYVARSRVLARLREETQHLKQE